MRILVMTVGSRGDVQPYLALGKGLQAAGHDVTICTAASFEAFVVQHGLNYAYMNDGFVDLLASAEGREAVERTTNVFGAIRTAASLWKQVGPLQRDMLADTWKAAETVRPDLIIFHPKAYGGPMFAERLGASVAMATALPQLVPTGECPTIGFPDLGLGRFYNRLTYGFVWKMSALFGSKFIKEWRADHGLPARPFKSWIEDSEGAPIPVLHAFSREVFARPRDWPDNAVVTGYWFLNRLENWRPSGALSEFLDTGEPPVYVGFGSMAGRDPERLTGIVVESLENAGVRGVLATGWGGLTEADLPGSILRIRDVPHDWLFPRMAAVVHHGGAGTTAAGFRAGRPSIVVPFFGDQPFWGGRVAALGVGLRPLPQKKLSVDTLTSAIHAVMSDDAMRARAERLGDRIRQEDGVGDAVRLLEEWKYGRDAARSEEIS